MLSKARRSLFKQMCWGCHWTQSNFHHHETAITRRGCSSNANEATFNKVLIANRGEIACRIIRTAKRMGIKTVAVYSVADSQAKHVQMADEAVFIGPSPAMESYLSIKKIMQAIRKTSADAVHPGYGFLSENPDFATLLESENVAFIGPSADVISRMGDKLESKRTALAAGVNVIPGFDDIVPDADHCIHIARTIGYPVMIKAAAGGGGKGMRVARNDQEVREGFLLSTQEALSSFGDTRMLVEKYIDSPRHIELQVLGDQHGNVIHLNERECSIQRRNQKVVEEAPSVLLDEVTRQAMGKQAVALCKQLGYYSAGTVEFLMDEKKNFYFLEMNTRIQVEHPVTEFITGIDLIEQMFRIAKGHQLGMVQEDIKIHGWAIESRVYAEDPYVNFGLPCTGRLYKYQEPQHLEGVRCDSGVQEGSKISMHYDPLICKLVCNANTRKEAIQKSIKALDSYIIRGISHNIPLLRDVLTQTKFHEGRISANYLPEVYPEGFKGLRLKERDRRKLVAVGAALFAANELRSRCFINIPDFKIRGKSLENWHLFIRFDEEELYVDVAQTNGQFRIEVAGSVFSIDKSEIKLSELIIKPTVDGKASAFQLLAKSAGGEYQIIYKGNNYTLLILSRKASEYLSLMPQKLHEDQFNEVRAPMSGLVKSVLCAEGDWVLKGQELLVIEAMKMQNFVVAQSDARVKGINVAVGDTVRNGETLVQLD